MNGNAVMYDASQGKILTLGGASSYTEAPATRAAHIITLRGRDGDGEGHVPETAVNVEAVEPMHYARAFANSVVLPNGDVFTNGGVTWAKQWTDINASQIPEMWHPQTRRFSRLAASPIPRSYHSFALLLPDARVLVGGGGLCWEACEDPSANHLDVQVYNPPYLYRGGAWSGAAAASPRPEILSLSSSVAAPGDEFTIVTDGPVADVALIRYGSSTHPINTDQRRIPLWPGPGKQQQEGNRWNYTVELPRDGGVLIPGYWMVFVLDGRGVPSISARLMVSVAE
jgi:galactose oxidase